MARRGPGGPGGAGAPFMAAGAKEPSLSHEVRVVPCCRCLAKRRCFAPAALYKPFGAEAAGTRTLPQFQALQDRSQETASLRELGLSDAEIHLWKNCAAGHKVGSELGQAGGRAGWLLAEGAARSLCKRGLATSLRQGACMHAYGPVGRP